MLEFTDVFRNGHDMTDCYKDEAIRTIMECKNIDYGHVIWMFSKKDFYNNINCMIHMIDNIIDVNTHDYHCANTYTFFVKVMYNCSILQITNYMLNNGYINNTSFEDYFDLTRTQHCFKRVNYPNKHFDKLVNYLTKVSLSKFKGYYNLEKYYDMFHIMLLVMKAQQRLPTAIIKHLIIPFVYQ